MTQKVRSLCSGLLSMESSTWLSQRTSCRQTHRWWWSKGWLVPFKQWVAPTWEWKWNPKRAGWSHPSVVLPNNIVMQPSQKCKPECKLWVPLGTQFLLISVGIRLLICRILSGICHWILLPLPSKSRENLFYYTVSVSIPCQEKGGKNNTCASYTWFMFFLQGDNNRTSTKRYIIMFGF